MAAPASPNAKEFHSFITVAGRIIKHGTLYFNHDLNFQAYKGVGRGQGNKSALKRCKKTLVSVPFISYTPVCRHFLSHVVLGSWYLPLPLPKTNGRI